MKDKMTTLRQKQKSCISKFIGKGNTVHLLLHNLSEKSTDLQIKSIYLHRMQLI
jgi:hypothetical protein